jgi:5-formyltetrahydrofolate cyclo-ligase
LSVDDIRRLIRSRRDGLVANAQVVAAQQLADRIVASSIYQDSQHIAVYWAIDGEINLQPLISRAWRQGKQCYLPVVRNQSLVFVLYSKNTAMHKNVFGIPEPEACEHFIPATELDLVLTPLVAFDGLCHRIGMGGGYYDRTFAFLGAQEQRLGSVQESRGERKNTSHPFLMGVAHECQQMDIITPEPWDVVLHSICTDIAEIKACPPTDPLS